MQLAKMKLVTIIGEEILKNRLVKKVQELGATGASFNRTQGVGARGARHNDMFGENMQIRVVCTAAVADKIMQHVLDTYFEHYALIAWTTDIEVMHGELYVKPEEC